MPRRRILNGVEREVFDLPPIFNSAERKRYFDFRREPCAHVWAPGNRQLCAAPKLRDVKVEHRLNVGMAAR